MFFFSYEGVSTTEGEPWDAQRNFLNTHLLNLVKGKGSHRLHDIIMDEFNDMKMELRKKVTFTQNLTYSKQYRYLYANQKF